MAVWAALLMWVVALAGANGEPPREVRLTGTVEYHDGGVQIGGEADPSGYILARATNRTPLFLRCEGSLVHPRLKALAGRRVAVSGVLGEIHVGGVETPRRSFPVLDVVSIWAIKAAGADR